MKNMVRNEDAFKQRFRTAKGVRTRFFSVLGPQSGLWPKSQKKSSPDPFHENVVRKVYAAKISGPYQLFYGSGPIFFFCGVNGAYETEKSWGRGCAIRDVAHFATKRKPNLCLKTYQNQQKYNQTDDNCYLMKTICCKKTFFVSTNRTE